MMKVILIYGKNVCDVKLIDLKKSSAECATNCTVGTRTQSILF